MIRPFIGPEFVSLACFLHYVCEMWHVLCLTLTAIHITTSECVCVRTHAHAQGFGNNKGFIEHLLLLEISLNFYVATLAWHERADYNGISVCSAKCLLLFRRLEKSEDDIVLKKKQNTVVHLQCKRFLVKGINPVCFLEKKKKKKTSQTLSSTWYCEYFIFHNEWTKLNVSYLKPVICYCA